MSSDTPTNDSTVFNRNLARIAVGAYDDAQEARKSAMNRVRDLVRKRNEGIPFDQVEEEKDEQSFSSKYDDDNLPVLIEEMREEGDLTEEEFDYLRQMLSIATITADIEEQCQQVMKLTENEPIYKAWLQNVYGISTTLTARLIHRFGYCEDREHPTQIWAYAGMAPGQRRRRGERAGYDPQAKTLAWLCANRMKMQGSRSRYKEEFFDPYKAEQVRRMEESRCQFCGEPTARYDGNAQEFAHPRDGCTEFLQSQLRRSTVAPSNDPEDVRALAESGDLLDRDAEAVYQMIENQGYASEVDDFGLEHFVLPDDVSDEATPPWNRGHADQRADRYLAKKFLKHYWALTRDIRGLETPDEWVLAHADHTKQEDTFENPYYARRALTDPTE